MTATGLDVFNERDLRASTRDLLGKTVAVLFSLLLVGATISPVFENWSESPTDNFPLSYYPMFSAKRGETYSVNYLVGLDAESNRYVIPYNLAGSGGLNQTRRQINKLIREKKASSLGRTVAAKVARQKSAPYTDITTIQVISGSFSFDDYFHGKKEAESERVRATVRVKRGES